MVMAAPRRRMTRGPVDPSPPPPTHSNQEDVIFSLTERLREREAEIRQLRQASPRAYEELVSHAQRLEEECRAGEALRREVEGENCRLNHLLDEQEKALARGEREKEDALEQMQRQLHAAMGESAEKDERMRLLEETANGLAVEAERGRQQEDEDKALLVRLGERVESDRHEQHALHVANEDLEDRVETQRQLLQAKAEEMAELQRYHDHREDELANDIERMRRRHNDYVDEQAAAVAEREEEIRLLYQQCQKYEVNLGEAEYMTYEQQIGLRAKKQEVERLSGAIERGQNAGLFGQLDTMCGSTHSVLGDGPK